MISFNTNLGRTYNVYTIKLSVLLLKRGIMKYVLQSRFQNFDNQYPPEKFKFFLKHNIYNLYFHIHLKNPISLSKFVKEWPCLPITLTIISCALLNNRTFLYIMFFVDKGLLERKKGFLWMFFDRFMKVNSTTLYLYISEQYAFD